MPIIRNKYLRMLAAFVMAIVVVLDMMYLTFFMFSFCTISWPLTKEQGLGLAGAHIVGIPAGVLAAFLYSEVFTSKEQHDDQAP